jgi:hypothetical protein
MDIDLLAALLTIARCAGREKTTTEDVWKTFREFVITLQQGEL